MTEFDSLYSALTYSPICPMCKHGIKLMDSLSGSPISAIKINVDGSNLCLYPEIVYTMIDSNYEDTYTFRLDSKVVQRTIKEKLDYEPAGSHGQSLVRHSARYPVYSGKQYIAFHVNCKNCSKYNFVIQVVIDLDSSFIDHILLNSESMVFFDETGRIEIKNVYSTNQTDYCYSSGEAKKGVEHFPLIPLDWEDPQKTLKRLKNLLIFT